MIELSIPQIETLQKKLEKFPRDIPVVTARAINRASESARTQAGRAARENYAIKHKEVISTIKIRKAYPANLYSEIRSIGGVLELTKFNVRPGKPQTQMGKKQVTVRVKKGSSKPINGAFVAGMNNGHINVFTRVSKSRLPIRGHYGPSIPQMIGNDDVVALIESKAYEVLSIRLDHEINRIIGGNG